MKVLYVTQRELLHYRLPIFKLVNAEENIELTLGHCGKQKKQDDMPEILLKNKKYGPLNKFEDFAKICDQFDVILCMAYFQNLAILKMLLNRKRKYKVVLWSIGVRASTKGHGYDSESNLDGLKEFFFKKGDALLFYSDYPIAKHEARGIPREKMFVANNTVEVLKIDPDEVTEKTQFLFVGSLYATKGLDVLIEAYANAYKECPGLYDMIIVGDGDRPRYEAMIKNLGLENKIKLTGGIYEEKGLAEQFTKSILCLSPNQAGLTVLKSLGYGVPFVTAKDAITGGERFNVIEGETGFFCDSREAITKLMVDSFNNPEKYKVVGKKAYDYYWANRTPQRMAQGIIDAIKYVTK